MWLKTPTSEVQNPDKCGSKPIPVWLKTPTVQTVSTEGATMTEEEIRTFSGTMLRLGMERSMEIVRTFASELRQGEMDGIRNLPALLMKRLQQNCG